jgi:two-component system NtrC family sensor kinase
MVDGGRLTIHAAAVRLETADLGDNEDAEPGDFIAITVQDTGSGMTPEVRARAFEPFFTTKEVGKGTGLGLSQVYGFIRQLHGHIEIASAPDAGTTVTLHLPVSEAPAVPAEPIGVAHVGPPLDRVATVLVVEDEATVLNATADALREAGWRVLTARNGMDALAVLRGDAAVDLLFSDVVMPGGMNGVALTRAARALRPALPVLLTSGYAEGALEADGLGVTILPKPYEHHDLQLRLAAALAGRSGGPAG